MVAIRKFSDLKEKLPTTFYITAQEFCDILGLTCPSIYADKQLGIPVSGIKRLMDAAGDSPVQVELAVTIPTSLPVVPLKESRFARKFDATKDYQKQIDFWLEMNAELFRLVHIQCADYECYVSVKAMSGNGLPTKTKR